MKQSNLILAAFLLFLFFGILFSIEIYFDCKDPKIMNTTDLALCNFGRFIKEFQSLIAGFFAIAAALVAAIPVYKQLELIQKQILISSIEHTESTLGRHIAAADAIKLISSKLQDEIFYILGELDGSLKFTGNPYRAFECERIVSKKIQEFKEAIKSSVVGNEIEGLQRIVLFSLLGIEILFSSIHLPVSDAGNPEVSEADETELREEAKKAEMQIEEKYKDTIKNLEHLVELYQKEIKKIKIELRRKSSIAMEN